MPANVRHLIIVALNLLVLWAALAVAEDQPITAFVRQVPASGDNWPCWRGPNRDSVADGRSLPIRWSQTENVRWSVKLPGWGTSSPVVYRGRAFVTSQQEQGGKKSLLTLCYDRKSGKELWRQDFGFGVDQHTHKKSNLAANTPAVAEDAIYVAFGNADIARYSHDGKLAWVTRYIPTFGDPKMAWGYNLSPLVLDDAVLFSWDHYTGPCYLIGLDKMTGKIAWKMDRPIGTAHATPLPVEHHGQLDILVPGEEPPHGVRCSTMSNCGDTARGKGRSMARSSSAPSTGTAWCSCNCGVRAKSTPSG